MIYKIVDLFGKHESKGTFDDLYSSEKYKSLQQAYDANDYVQMDYCINEDGTLHIQAFNTKSPDIKKYYCLNFQRPICGIDVLDDGNAVNMGASLL